jgi:ubiquinone/menaquinone biosynthesis C-methylase UbiE
MMNTKIPPTGQDPESAVRQYYDDNSKFFLRLGQNARSGSIHQPLYLQPGDSIREAIHAQHMLLANIIMETGDRKPFVLDLGCGTGSAMAYLRKCTNKENFAGVTISRFQATQGREFLARSGMTEYCQIHEGSYLALPFDAETTDLAYAIESLIHCTDLPRFLLEVHRVLKAGARLVIFDDFLTDQSSIQNNSEAHETLELFHRHWKANCLVTTDMLIEAGETVGLTSGQVLDFTQKLKLNRVRDRWIRYFYLPVLKMIAPEWSYTRFLSGGDARQRAYRAGLLRYCMIILEKTDPNKADL